MHNIAEKLREFAGTMPNSPALTIFNANPKNGVHPGFTFRELEERSNFLAWGLNNEGVRPGMTSILMAPPSLELYALYFALLKTGAVPVFLPCGADWSIKLSCLMQCNPKVFVGTAGSFLAKVFFGRAFSTVDISIMLGKYRLFGGTPTGKLRGENRPYPIYDCTEDSRTAIVFSSGSSDVPKGAIWTAANAGAQIAAMEDLSDKSGPDLSTLPLLTIMDICRGKHVIVPSESGSMQDMSDALSRCRGIALADSDFWNENAKQPRTDADAAIICRSSATELQRELNSATTKALSIYSMAEHSFTALTDGTDMLEKMSSEENLQNGVFLGKAMTGTEIRIIPVSDEKIPDIKDAAPVKAGETGEICLRGKGVALSYAGRPEDSSMAVIEDNGTLWLRSGDLGCLDKDGCLWYHGRKAHRVITPAGTLYTACCEEIANCIPGIRQSMLVGVGDPPEQIPVMIIEPEQNDYARLADSPDEIINHLSAFTVTAGIKHVLFKHKLDRDVAKCRQWAAERM